MKIKTFELIGPALDWAVELAKGTYWSPNGYFVFKNPDGTTKMFHRNPEWRYSTEWSQSGPIIEREWINFYEHDPRFYPGLWRAWHRSTGASGSGSTPLIAAMRCYVTSKLGDEVDIPQELLTA